MTLFQVASRWVFITVGLLYMIFGVIGKFSAIFIMIPEPVLGGALISITGVFIGKYIYYIPITDKTLELFVFCPSDTESRINELRFSESISLSFKTRLTSVTCFCGDVT